MAERRVGGDGVTKCARQLNDSETIHKMITRIVLMSFIEVR